jgi:hypothetical protein
MLYVKQVKVIIIHYIQESYVICETGESYYSTLHTGILCDV